jgi:hypothetical protein
VSVTAAGSGSAGAPGTSRQDSVHALFPQLGMKDPAQFIKSEASPIPKIYFSQTFTLASSETFREVFAVDANGLPSKLIQVWIIFIYVV